MNLKFDWTEKYAPLVLRLGMAIVFLYFGISQLINPLPFVGWLPSEASLIPIQPYILVILNGAFETIFGVLLAIGWFRRIAALLLGLHLLAITISIGWTEIGVRDLGLSIAGLVIALIEEDRYSLDYLFSHRDGTAGES